jgi:hypothetical protein
MDHVTFGMPVLILAVSVYLYELLQNGRLTTIAFLSELS